MQCVKVKMKNSVSADLAKGQVLWLSESCREPSCDMGTVLTLGALDHRGMPRSPLARRIRCRDLLVRTIVGRTASYHRRGRTRLGSVWLFFPHWPSPSGTSIRILVVIKILTPVVALVAARISRRTPLDLGGLGLGNGKILERLAFLLKLVKAVRKHGLLDLNKNDVNNRHLEGGSLRRLEDVVGKVVQR